MPMQPLFHLRKPEWMPLKDIPQNLGYFGYLDTHRSGSGEMPPGVWDWQLWFLDINVTTSPDHPDETVCGVVLGLWTGCLLSFLSSDWHPCCHCTHNATNYGCQYKSLGSSISSKPNVLDVLPVRHLHRTTLQRGRSAYLLFGGNISSHFRAARRVVQHMHAVARWTCLVCTYQNRDVRRRSLISA